MQRTLRRCRDLCNLDAAKAGTDVDTLYGLLTQSGWTGGVGDGANCQHSTENGAHHADAVLRCRSGRPRQFIEVVRLGRYERGHIVDEVMAFEGEVLVSKITGGLIQQVQPLQELRASNGIHVAPSLPDAV